MRLTQIGLSVVLLACAMVRAGQPVSEADLFDARFKSEIAPIFAKNCHECHGEKKKKGGLRLDEPVDLKVITADTEKWQSLITQVRTGEMPPEGKTKLAPKDVEALVKWATDAVALADSKRTKDPGYVLPRRLNRTEYNNTIRDLTGLNIKPADSFPVDDSGYGFDNIADVLTMSPLLAEKYLDTAEMIIETGFGAAGKKAGGAAPAGPPAKAIDDKRFKLKDGVNTAGGLLTFFSNGEATFALEGSSGSEYTLRATAWQSKAGTEAAKLVIRVDGKEIASVNVPNAEESPFKLEQKIKATAAKHDVTIAFTNDLYDEKTKQDRNLYVTDVAVAGLGGGGGGSTASGGGNSEFERLVLISQPSKTVNDKTAAELVLRNFATRAFRRPATSVEVSKLIAIYEAGKKDGDHNVGLKRALTAVLVAPSFLYRSEAAPAGGGGAVWNLNDYEIASRLSYFLWSSMPDEKLFKMAQGKMLVDPKLREAEIKRMLADPKSQALIENFAGQWLELRNLDEIMMDTKRFPEWNPKLADSMKREGELLFEEVMRQDRNVLDLISADFTYVDGALANLYGIKGVSGNDFKRVSTAGTPRGGILTMASTLAVTSNPTRTSPVKRGKWILENILGTPPPPPPPEIPALSEKAADEASAPLKVRLEKHRADPSCAVCHNRMDGYGFALENFDAIGKWRDKDGTFKVDSIGVIPGEPNINGAADLKQSVMKRKEQVVKAFAEKLMTYALGRGMKVGDRLTLNEIAQKCEAGGNKFSALMLAIVDSDAFLKRRDKRGDEK